MEATSRSVLKKCELKIAEDTGRELVQGCYYAKIGEVTYRGLRCLARTINADYLKAVSARERNAELLDHLYESHCAQLLELRHPNLLQFIGVRYSQNQLSLVSEQLPMTLSETLEQYERLPDSINYSILRDVALGMVYLHSRSPTPVIHGELAASNVYLTVDLTAKITDMGIMNMLNLTPSRRKAIGYKALAHLPPETLALPSAERSPSRAAQVMLSKKLDSYSYGVLMVHVLSAQFPEYIARRAHSLCGTLLKPSDDANGVDDILGGVKTDHPLSSLILQCINHMADLRPEMGQILSTIMEMMLQFPTHSVEKRLEVLHSIVSQKRKADGMSKSKPVITRKDSITTLANSLEIEHLKLQIQELQVENKGLRMSLTKQREIVSARDHEMAAKLMAKDQEIMAKHQELSAQEAMVEAYKATITAKEGTLTVLTSQMQHLQGYIANKHEPHLLNPKAQLRWRQCAHLPQAMVFAQAITIGDSVYFGSGTSTLTESECLRFKIYKYDALSDRWSPVSHCPVIAFGMVNFQDRLTLVGGAYESQDDDSSSPFSLTGDVHVLSADGSKFNQPLAALSTPRLLPTVLAYGSTIVACGGFVLDEKRDSCVSHVEVYSQLNSQWYQAEPLPFACIGMTYSCVRDYCYFLGGFTDTEFDHPTTAVFTVCLPQLIEKALMTKDTGSGGGGGGDADSKEGRLWQRFPDSPRYAASLTTIGECLVAIGGSDENLEHKSGALHVYSPVTSSWLRLDDIPVACFACAVPRLPKGELLIIGGMGHDEEDALKTVFRGRISLD